MLPSRFISRKMVIVTWTPFAVATDLRAAAYFPFFPSPTRFALHRIFPSHTNLLTSPETKKKKKIILGYGVFVQVQQRHAPRSEVLFQTGKMIENGHQVQTVITSINNRHHFRFGAAKKHEELITRNLDGKIKHGHVNHSIPHDTDIPIAL